MGCDIHGFVEFDDYKERLEYREKRWKEDYIKWIKPLEEQGTAITKEQWLDKVNHDWQSVIDLSLILHRNYDLFAFFFGVRRVRPESDYGYKPIAPNRNLPEDVGWWTKSMSNAYGSDGHSHSWITLKEIKKINWKKPKGKIAQFIQDEYFTKLVKIMEVFNDGSDENVRMVVWFDN